MGDNYLDALILELNKDSDEDATTGGGQDAADSGEGPGVVHIRGEVPGGGQDAADTGEGPGGGHFRGEVPGVGQDAADTGENIELNESLTDIDAMEGGFIQLCMDINILSNCGDILWCGFIIWY